MIKILINYLQIMMIMLNFKVGWPGVAIWFFTVAGFISDIDNFIAVDCLLGENAILLKIVCMAVAPFFAIIGAGLFWGCV